MVAVMPARRAKALGHGRYFTGVPCKHGHLCERYTRDRSCVQCVRDNYRRWQKAHPERYKDFSKEYHRRDRGQIEAPTRQKPEHCENPGCQWPTAERTRTLFEDHCHKTGLFRGWLCDNCNNGIGKLGDTLEGLTGAIEYLQRFQRAVK